MTPELQAATEKFRQSASWAAFERRLQQQHEFITTRFQMTFSESAIEQLRQALTDIKPCETCDRRTCPKTNGYAYSFVAKVDWWNEQISQRRVADCRQTTAPVPTWQDFKQQIDSQQREIDAERKKLADAGWAPQAAQSVQSTGLTVLSAVLKTQHSLT